MFYVLLSYSPFKCQVIYNSWAHGDCIRATVKSVGQSSIRLFIFSTVYRPGLLILAVWTGVDYGRESTAPKLLGICWNASVIFPRNILTRPTNPQKIFPLSVTILQILVGNEWHPPKSEVVTTRRHEDMSTWSQFLSMHARSIFTCVDTVRLWRTPSDTNRK